MGMYDTLWVQCPQCGEEIDYQSKGGNCNMRNYTVLNVPPDVAGYIDGESQWCKNCDAEVTIQVLCIVQAHVTGRR